MASPGAVALPCAVQVMTEPLSTPRAVPDQLQLAGTGRAERTSRRSRVLIRDIPLEIGAGARRGDRGRRGPGARQGADTGRGWCKSALVLEIEAAGRGCRDRNRACRECRFLHTCVRPRSESGRARGELRLAAIHCYRPGAAELGVNAHYTTRSSCARDVPVAVEVVAQRLGRALERELVPGNGLLGVNRRASRHSSSPHNSPPSAVAA